MALGQHEISVFFNPSILFGKPANYYNLGKQSPLTIFFNLLHSLPMLYPLWESQERHFIVKLTGESFRFHIFLKFSGLQFCYIVFQRQFSSTEIYLSALLQGFPNSGKGCWGGIRNFTVGWGGGLPVEGNLRSSDFDQLQSKLTWPKFPKSMRLKQKWNRNNDYSEKCCFYWVITWKLLFSRRDWLLVGGGGDFLDGGYE